MIEGGGMWSKYVVQTLVITRLKLGLDFFWLKILRIPWQVASEKGYETYMMLN